MHSAANKGKDKKPIGNSGALTNLFSLSSRADQLMRRGFGVNLMKAKGKPAEVVTEMKEQAAGLGEDTKVAVDSLCDCLDKIKEFEDPDLLREALIELGGLCATAIDCLAQTTLKPEESLAFLEAVALESKQGGPLMAELCLNHQASLGKLSKLKSVDLSVAGQTFSSHAELCKVQLVCLGKLGLEDCVSPEVNKCLTAVEDEFLDEGKERAKVKGATKEILGSFDPQTEVRAQGRTLVWTDKNGKSLCIKVQKKNEPATEMTRELAMQQVLGGEFGKKGLGLKSDIPSPKGVFALELPADWIRKIEETGNPVREPAKDGRYTCFVYETDPDSKYLKYPADAVSVVGGLEPYKPYLPLPNPDDPKDPANSDTHAKNAKIGEINAELRKANLEKLLTNGDFQAGMDKCMSDLFRLAGNGWIFSQLVDMYHSSGEDTTRTTDGGGRYLLTLDLHRPVDIGHKERGGAGKIGDVVGAVRYANVRPTGLADLGDSVSLPVVVDAVTVLRDTYVKLFKDKENGDALRKTLASGESQDLWLFVHDPEKRAGLKERLVGQWAKDSAEWQELAKKIQPKYEGAMEDIRRKQFEEKQEPLDEAVKKELLLEVDRHAKSFKETEEFYDQAIASEGFEAFKSQNQSDPEIAGATEPGALAELLAKRANPPLASDEERKAECERKLLASVKLDFTNDVLELFGDVLDVEDREAFEAIKLKMTESHADELGTVDRLTEVVGRTEVPHWGQIKHFCGAAQKCADEGIDVEASVTTAYAAEYFTSAMLLTSGYFTNTPEIRDALFDEVLFKCDAEPIDEETCPALKKLSESYFQSALCSACGFLGLDLTAMEDEQKTELEKCLRGCVDYDRLAKQTAFFRTDAYVTMFENDTTEMPGLKDLKPERIQALAELARKGVAVDEILGSAEHSALIPEELLLALKGQDEGAAQDAEEKINRLLSNALISAGQESDNPDDSATPGKGLFASKVEELGLYGDAEFHLEFTKEGEGWESSRNATWNRGQYLEELTERFPKVMALLGSPDCPQDLIPAIEEVKDGKAFIEAIKGSAESDDAQRFGRGLGPQQIRGWLNIPELGGDERMASGYGVDLGACNGQMPVKELEQMAYRLIPAFFLLKNNNVFGKQGGAQKL